MQSPLPRSNTSTPTQLTPTDAPHNNASSRTAAPPATNTEFSAHGSQFDSIGGSQVKARIRRRDVGSVTALVRDLPATSDRPRPKFDEFEKSNNVLINESTVNDVGGHQLDIILGSNSTFCPGTIPLSPTPRNPPAYSTDPSTRRVEYTLSRHSKVNGNQITIQSNDDKDV